jgi:hypothetical protein
MVLPNENVTGGTMSNNDEMTIDERYKYLRKMQKRYKKAREQERSQLLDEMQEVTGYHRKHLLRLMHSKIVRKPRQRQRGRTYGVEVVHALQVIAESFDYPCAERLLHNLDWMAKHLEIHGELELCPSLIHQLENISVSTIRRILKGLSRDKPRLPRKNPKDANRYRRNVPTRRIPWNEQKPGFFEADLVHHCGVSPSGQYVHSLQMIDVATGWSERVAILGRSYLVMQDAFHRILSRLPFPVLEIHPDNGGEFFNAHLINFWEDTIQGVELSRSRPYFKNDNRFVEQKNSTEIRAYVGYDRLDTVDQTNLLNQLYDRLWIYYNLFQPVMRITEKNVVPSKNGSYRIKRRYDDAKTPFDRLSASNQLDPEERERLEQLRQDTNPRKLRSEIYHLLDELHRLPNASENHSEDVYHTLFELPESMKGEDISVTLSNDRTIYAG